MDKIIKVQDLVMHLFVVYAIPIKRKTKRRLKI